MKKETILKLLKSVEFVAVVAFVIIGGFAEAVAWDWGLAFISVYLMLNIFGFANRSVVKKENNSKAGEGTDPDKEEK